MLNIKYDFSSVHVNVPVEISEDIIEWGKTKIKDNDLYVSQKDPSFGREDEIHITILYGIHTEHHKDIVKMLKGEGPIVVTLGKINVFTSQSNFDVVMIQIESQDLKRLNRLIVENVPHTNKYGAYKPHLTIGYVKKGKGWKHVGGSRWNGIKFECKHVVFSSKNGSKHQFLI